MATSRHTTTTQRKCRSAQQTTIDIALKIKPRGLYGLYKGQMTLNGTSNEVFNLGL